MEITKVILGIEVHIELKTLSKMFCGCPADHFAKKPNTQTCPVCLGLPGALPVPNKKAIDLTILLGLALGCEIPTESHFDRKNYFYPDLPKGYQISQYDKPFAENGKIFLADKKEIKIRRVHLEEDTAKLLHEEVAGEKVTLIDFNRSGVALAEIVTEPDINSSDEAKDYLEKLHQLVRYLEISDADMDKGSMRCEPNINLEISDSGKVFYTPITELKNINSFKFVKNAIDFEIARQFEEFKNTKKEKQAGNKQTRGWDENKQITFLQREKEEANDYRYFPEPDIPPIVWTKDQISAYRSQLTTIELPWVKKDRFIKHYGLSDYQAKILTEKKEQADYYESCVKLGNTKDVSVVEIANTLINKRLPDKLKPEEVIARILASKQTTNASDKEIEELILKMLADHPEAIAGYKSGKPQALGMIVGLVKKETGIIVSLETIIKLAAGCK